MTKEEIVKNLAEVSLYEGVGTNTLYPELRGIAQALVSTMNQLGKPILITECFRSAKKQADYYARGRTSPGSSITNARELQSYHQYGLAFDVMFVNHGYNPPADWWEELGKEGQRLGLVWGGTFFDKPHFEFSKELTWQELKSYFESEEDEKLYLESFLIGLSALVKRLLGK